MASPLFIICFLVTISILSGSVSSQFSYTINIENKVSEAARVHCFLRGQPVFQMKILDGPHNIEVPVIVGGDNRLICDIALTVFLKKQGRFQLFDFETDKNRCHIAERSCHWEIQDRGMCMGYRYSCNPFLPWNEVITEQLY
ncbi:hypothetical protein P3S68_013371 [Capsicum galapagoense]